jgi:hypothetical protein
MRRQYLGAACNERGDLFVDAIAIYVCIIAIVILVRTSAKRSRNHPPDGRQQRWWQQEQMRQAEMAAHQRQQPDNLGVFGTQNNPPWTPDSS